jgi:signal peptidase II
MKRSRWFELMLFALAACAGLAADLGSKSAVFEAVELRAGDPIVLIPGWLQFVSRLNNGGIWSVGAQFGEHANTALIGFASGASLLILAWAYFSIQLGERVFPIVLGGILSGALGNLHDRFVFNGVRDFIEFHYRDVWYYPTFNIADSMLVCGAVYLVLSSLLGSLVPASANLASRPAAGGASGLL